MSTIEKTRPTSKPAEKPAQPRHRSTGRNWLRSGFRFVRLLRGRAKGQHVEGFRGETVVIRDQFGNTTEQHIVDFVLDESTKLPERLDLSRSASPRILELLPPEQQAALQQLVDDTEEVLNGHPSGDRSLPTRKGYERHLPLGIRQANKAKERHCDPRTIRRNCKAYTEDGREGLINKKYLRPRSRFQSVDYRLRDALMSEIAAKRIEGTTTSKLVLKTLAEARLERDIGLGVVPLVSYSLVCQVIDELQAGNPVTRGSAKTRKSITGRPSERFAPREVTRPGEFVQFDSTVLDIFCRDRVSGRVFRPELTVAMDRYTRCIVGLIVTEHTRKEDVAAVISEIIRPVKVNPEWGPKARWPYHGLVERIQGPTNPRFPMQLDTPNAPVINPETFIVDNGAPFISHHVRSICAQLGVSIEPTRPYRGTDKAQIERFFGTLSRGLLAYLPGYTTGSVAGKGDGAMGDAYFFVDEISDVIREWIARVYHVRPHLGTNVPEAGVSKLSPYEMYCVGVEKAGLIVPQANPDLWMRLLPHVARKITAKPLEIRGLLYDAPILKDYANLSSAEPDGKYTFHYDPNDRRQVYFSTGPGVWHEIPWILRERVDVPFGDDALDMVRRLNLDNRVKKKVLDRTMLDLVQKFRLGNATTEHERAAATRMDLYLRKLWNENKGLESTPVSTVASDALHARTGSDDLNAIDLEDQPAPEDDIIVDAEHDPDGFDDLKYEISEFLHTA
ncbi:MULTISPECIES: DDE-type integrase/transposase/recombinase [unclassified Frondihabitans]|uniref:DDE-type integrase/transposase/recombinase n=1 Tax=unclassified Frondihabitans TaxID=2626248 RepID=UPI000F4FE50B|nr:MULTISPECIES: DDE-type integrase/transposase/recombinase [unclassified Frondihabitans]RPE77793.1 integrase-like protein [Frondihabitans sp. PhB153]RPF08072.1 integrase-like protein [Frondihabitans sp. PhB161]